MVRSKGVTKSEAPGRNCVPKIIGPPYRLPAGSKPVVQKHLCAEGDRDIGGPIHFIRVWAGKEFVSALAISWIAFASVFGGSLLGMLLRAALPENHQNEEAKDVLKLLAGLVGTMAALVIGLLIATAASSFTRGA